MIDKQVIRKKILILDSGMKGLIGHNFTYTRAVQNGIEKLGYEVDVIANKALSSDLAQTFGYKQIFTYGAYDFPPPSGNILHVLKYLQHQGEAYSRELEEFFQNRLSDYAAVFCHTIGDFELIGWNKFLSRRKLDSHLLMLSRTTANFEESNFFKRKLHPFHSIKFRYLRSIYKKMNGNFTLLTDNEPLTRDFSFIFKHRIVTFPIPINKYFLHESAGQNDTLNDFRKRYRIDKQNGFCIGYMGDAKESKGFYLLPKVVETLLNSTDNTYFAIQCPKISADTKESEIPRGLPELYELEKKAEGRVILVTDKLNEEDYANMFRCLDIALIPYPLPGYTKATSGIFAEAVALGIPTIVTGKSWMAYELKKFQGGLEFKSDDAEDLSRKILDIIKNYEIFAAKSRSYSEKWCEFHNFQHLSEMLIAEIEK